ncbi:oleoyl-acyl carrier protein thioesterase 2, chloroplastic-like [Macadamia integrifolia]|uniref:oleoyl-acyl carrier protein thioesterase 2, chloroplastic-like n=1 Tax=Macadamia integrifolia TaxID=60698 RepID=UPI001C4EA700|nr:oleoyl-acyl carrier protein thioesterase 2, chloroplastic-like [Macadamia integrifolia]
MLPLKGCYRGAPDQLRFLPQCRSLAGPKALVRRGIANVSCCSSSLTSSPLRTSNIIISERANGSVGAALNQTTNGSASSVEQLQLGSGHLAKDGRSYKEKFIVRCYEVGMNKTATIDAIANLMQEAACNHVQSFTYSADGMGTTKTMRKLNLIWVTTRMHIEVYKYPTWGNMIEIETWFEARKVGTRRDFIIKDATGTLIGRATSKWVSMNKNTRRLQKVPDEVLEELVDFSPQTPRLAFPEEDTSSLKKIPKLEDPAKYAKLGLKAKRADLDMNQHVNNVTYIGWLLESMPQEIMDSHELQKVTLDYRRECQYGDVVDSLTSMELMEDVEAILELKGTNGSAIERKHKEDCCLFLHFLRFPRGGLEINRGRTEWKRKSTK